MRELKKFTICVGLNYLPNLLLVRLRETYFLYNNMYLFRQAYEQKPVSTNNRYLVLNHSPSGPGASAVLTSVHQSSSFILHCRRLSMGPRQQKVNSAITVTVGIAAV